MNKFEEDNKLRKLIKEINPESPDADFSSKVMTRIYEEQKAIERSATEQIFGLWFWLISAAFIVMCIAVIFLSGTPAETSPLGNLVPAAGKEVISGYYKAFSSLTESIPASVAGILFASSLLLLLERFLSARIKAAE
jgi:hypothetical protein